MISVPPPSLNRFSPLPLFLIAAVFILSSPIFWVGIESPDDARPTQGSGSGVLFKQVYPAMNYGYHRLAQGDIPLWNNQQLCGTPFLADPRNAMFQPLNVVFLFMETTRAMALHAFISLALMGFFFALYLRSMDLRYLPCVLGGMMYMCCGATAAVMSLPGYVPVLVWLPLLCLLIREYTLRQPQPVLVALGGLVTAFLMLSGSFLLIVAALTLSFGYGLLALIQGKSGGDVAGQAVEYSRWERLRGLLFMFAAGLLLSAVQWAPTLVWLQSLDNPLAFLRRFEVEGEIPYSIRGLLAQLLEAHAVRWPPLAYLGMAALLLLPAAPFHRLPRWEKIFLFSTVLGLWGIIILRGSRETPAPAAFSALAYPASFAACVLAALGADRLFATRRDPLTPRLWGPLLLVMLIFGGLFLIAPDAARGRMTPCVAALLLFALFRTNWAGVLSGMILLTFQFIDLNTSITNLQPHPFFAQGAGITMEPPLASLLRDTALDDRVLLSPYAGNERLHPNMGMSAGIRMAGAEGFPLTPEQQRWWDAFLNTPSTATSPEKTNGARAGLLNVMSVRAVAATRENAVEEAGLPVLRLRRRGTQADISVYANEDVLPRISWSQSWQIALETRAAMEALCAPDFDSRQKCIVVPVDTALSHLVQVMPEHAPAPEGVQSPTETQAVLRLIEDQPEQVVVEVEAPAAGILVLSDTYDAAWRANVDGRAAPVLRVNGLFRGVTLPEGKHKVAFYYQPRSFYLGAAVSLFTVLAFLLQRGRMLVRRRKR